MVYYTILCYTMLCFMVYCGVLWHTILYGVLLCALVYCTILYYAVLYSILWYTVGSIVYFIFPVYFPFQLTPSTQFGLVYWGLTPQQQPGSYQGDEMMMKSVFWWRKPEYPEETTDLRQVTDETFHTYGLCPDRGLNLGRSSVKQSELRRDESGALAHRATAVPPVVHSIHSCACCTVWVP